LEHVIENDLATRPVEKMAIQEIRVHDSAWNEKRPALSGRPYIKTGDSLTSAFCDVEANG
jgi:hypothetical protein